MKTNYFLILASGPDYDADETYDAFYEAGCDDATVAWQEETFKLYFHRDAASFGEALLTAYRDVVKAGVTVTRFEADASDTLPEEHPVLAQANAALEAQLKEGVDFQSAFKGLHTL